MNPAVRTGRFFCGGVFIFLWAFAGPLQSQDRFPAGPPGKSAPPPQAAPTAPGKPSANNAPSAPPPSASAPAPKFPPAAPAGAAPSKFAAVTALETEDFGVPASNQLRGEPQHAPTPTRLDGGNVITTEALAAMMQQNNSPFILLDVLGGERGLPGAQNAQPAGNAGTFADATQRDLGNYLQQATQGRRDVPVIFYCLNVQCWRSYNAALRAIKLGYTRVYWYRGGIEAWTQAGLPTYPRQ